MSTRGKSTRGSTSGLWWLWYFFLIGAVGVIGLDLFRYCSRVALERSWPEANARVLQVATVSQTRQSSSGRGTPNSLRTLKRLAVRLQYQSGAESREVWAYGEGVSVGRLVRWQEGMYRLGESIPIRVSPNDPQTVSLAADLSLRSLFEFYRLAATIAVLFLVIAGTYLLSRRRR